MIMTLLHTYESGHNPEQDSGKCWRGREPQERSVSVTAAGKEGAAAILEGSLVVSPKMKPALPT